MPPPTPTPNPAAAEFYKTRLEHTLTHTQRSTGHIYLVNGGLLGLLYFVASAQDLQPAAKVIVLFIGLAALTLINLLHARLLVLQRRWYELFSKKYAEATGAENATIKAGGFPRGTHGCYTAIHVVLAVAIFVLAVFLGVNGTTLFKGSVDEVKAPIGFHSEKSEKSP